MVSTDAHRTLVTARAGGACEYCRLIESACGVTQLIDIVPFQHFLPRILYLVCVATKNTKRHEEERCHSQPACRTGTNAFRSRDFLCFSWRSFRRHPIRLAADIGLLTLAILSPRQQNLWGPTQ